MALAASKNRWPILIADPDYAGSIPEVAAQFGNMELVCANETHSALALASGGEFIGLVAQSTPVDRSLLAALPNLRVVLKVGRNYYNIDAPTVRERGLIFAAAPRKGPNCVAELALTLILALSKDLLISHQSTADGHYRQRGLHPEHTSQRKHAFRWMQNMRVHEVSGKTLGLVGLGEINGELARRASVMGMHTLYYKRKPLTPELERCFLAEYRDLNTLLQKSDYVCLALPLTPETEKIIGRDELALMKPGAYLINVARGGVVDEEALIEALAQQCIAGAGLDVFTFEPLPADSPLGRLNNVILTPHIGGGTGSSRTLELSEALAELERILSGQSPRVNLS